MSDSPVQFSHAAPVFPVKNVDHAADFYRDQLGFEVTFRWEDPATYAVVKREGVGIHLSQLSEDYLPPKEHAALRVFVSDVDQLYAEFQHNNVAILRPIGDREYGMRDFDIKDKDGFILTFGTGLSLLKTTE
ncbi:MAG: VOC family protein [Bacteroidota bacterium]